MNGGEHILQAEHDRTLKAHNYLVTQVKGTETLLIYCGLQWKGSK